MAVFVRVCVCFEVCAGGVRARARVCVCVNFFPRKGGGFGDEGREYGF